MTTALRAVLYARYSTDKQRETSIGDQLRAARARAAAEGWNVVATHADEGVSGSTPVALRPGGKALLADALAGRLDILILEGLDRLSREIGEAETMVKRLEHRGIRIVGTADGYDTEARGRKVMRIARGLVNELYIDDLREKTHRGLAGQFGRGLSAGGRSYGYRTAAAAGGRVLVIDEAEAEQVRWIFARYAEGMSPVAIVHQLNHRGVAAPRGGSWAVSALQGSAARGLGLLHNELYAGRLVWNRRQWLKDPETGRRRYVERPRAEWHERDAPELRIVDAATWAAVRARVAGTARRGAAIATAQKGGRPARTLFAGLLRCPQCDGPVIAVSALRYGCGVHKDRGDAVCANRHTVLRQALDSRLLAELRQDLLGADMLAELQAAVRERLAAHTREAQAGSVQAHRRLQSLEGELGRLVDAIAAVGLSPALQQRLAAAEAERAALLASLSDDAPAQASLSGAEAVRAYKALLLDLQRSLEGLADRERTRALLARIVGPVQVIKGEDGATYARLGDPVAGLLRAAGAESLTVVAGTRSQGWRLVRISPR